MTLTDKGECFHCGEPEQAEHDDHNFCYCADSGRCEGCVERAVDHAEGLRDAYTEDGLDWRAM